MLVASEVEGEVSNRDQKDSNPSEWGGNLYYEQKITQTSWSLYGGFEHEKFSTYNTAELVSGSSLEKRDNNLSYATLGLTKRSQVFSAILISKLSFARSLFSQSSTGKKGDRFEGNRVLFFLKIKNENPFSYHLIFKNHALLGPTKLSINRLGMGIGYDF